MNAKERIKERIKKADMARRGVTYSEIEHLDKEKKITINTTIEVNKPCKRVRVNKRMPLEEPKEKIGEQIRNMHEMHERVEREREKACILEYVKQLRAYVLISKFGNAASIAAFITGILFYIIALHGYCSTLQYIFIILMGLVMFFLIGKARINKMENNIVKDLKQLRADASISKFGNAASIATFFTGILLYIITLYGYCFTLQYIFLMLTGLVIFLFVLFLHRNK